MNLFLKRIGQVIKYGWKQSKGLSKNTKKGRVYILFDMIYCFFRYRIWTNQYTEEVFCLKSKEEREKIGRKYYDFAKRRDVWQKEFNSNRLFLNKYSSKKYELLSLHNKRNKAYTKRYNMGKKCHVEYNVEITRQHYFTGTITIGQNVLLAKNVFIDYSGGIIIGDNVQITDGVTIISHEHAHHHDPSKKASDKDNDIATLLTIDDGVVIGSKAIILSSCSRIGKFARVGAGAVVTKDVPDYATVVGIPARVIKYNNALNIEKE